MNFINLIYFLISICSCTHVYNRNKILNNEHSKENYIQTGGYYYSIYNIDNKSGFIGKKMKIQILLNNGYIYKLKNGYGQQCGRNIDLKCEINMSEKMLDNYLNNEEGGKTNSKLNIWNWGKYYLGKDSIMIQQYYNFKGNYYIIEETGKVLDSANFILTKRIDYRTKKAETILDGYTFKSYNVENIYNKTPKHF